VRRPGLTIVPPGTAAVRHCRRSGCGGASTLGKSGSLGAVGFGQDADALGSVGGATGGEELLVGAHYRRVPVPFHRHAGATCLWRARAGARAGRARASWAASVSGRPSDCSGLGFGFGLSFHIITDFCCCLENVDLGFFWPKNYDINFVRIYMMCSILEKYKSGL
jgi:hypothetical protein